MEIGIKYCGGCNPTYDRSKVVSKLKENIGQGYNIETAKPGIVYDIVVILCGCNSACASHQKLDVIYKKVFITNENDSINLINIIHRIKANI